MTTPTPTFPRLGGSTATRTLQCPGWSSLPPTGLPDLPSPAAEEGTRLHEAMAAMLGPRSGPSLSDAPEECLKALDMLHETFPGHTVQAVELTLTFPDLEDAGGTVDAVLSLPDSNGCAVVVVDWKFGHNPVNSPDQLYFYAACLRFPPGTQIALAIIQPHVGVRVWHTDQAAVDAWATTFREAVALGRGPNPPRTPGSHCRYCPSKLVCPAIRGVLPEAAAAVTPQDLAEAYARIPAIEAWVDEVRAQARAAAERSALPGYKLVAGRARRAWVKGYEEIIRRMRLVRKLSAPALVTPAQAERLLKGDPRWANIEALIETRRDRSTLVCEDDPREPVITLAAAAALLEKIHV